ncbi:MAG: TraB/GumN family protein [Clostridia bacterium]|nr:TraB/GumN family protein [Clostridia bacterium]
MMKRLIAILLSLLLIFAVTSCGKSTDDKKKNTTAKTDTASDKKDKTEKTGETDAPFLWQATDKNGRVIYFFGTIHAGDKRSKEILKRLQPTLKKCDALAVEFDSIAYSKDMSKQQDDVLLFMYDDGSTITDHIPEELYNKLVTLLTEQKLYNKVYDNFKPALWYQLYNQAIIKMADLKTNKGMDELLIKDAYSADREVLEVESSDFQNDLLVNAPDEYYTIAFKSEIDDIDKSVSGLNKLYELWLEGDENKIKEFAEDDEEIEGLTAEEEKIVEDFNEKLLTERNIGMVEKAKEYLESGKTVFFAVGAMHFIGDDGIKALLEKEGFRFKRVKY